MVVHKHTAASKSTSPSRTGQQVCFVWSPIPMWINPPNKSTQAPSFSVSIGHVSGFFGGGGHGVAGDGTTGAGFTGTGGLGTGTYVGGGGGDGYTTGGGGGDGYTTGGWTCGGGGLTVGGFGT